MIVKIYTMQFVYLLCNIASKRESIEEDNTQ